MEIPESRLIFVFDDKYNVIKHDESVFYKEFFAKLPSGKGVDIIADSDDEALLIEIKNCSSYECENSWRTKVGSTKTTATGQLEDSFDIDG